MEEALLTSIVTYGGYILAGVFVALGMFGVQFRQRRNDNNEVTQNLIANYKLTVDEQDKKIKLSQEREIEQGKEIAHLQGQVKVLSDILQGRDPSMVAFLKDAPVLITIARENNGLAKANSEAITMLTKTISDLVGEMRSH